MMANQQKATILLVDDSRLNHLILKSYLQPGRFQVTSAQNGREAVQMFINESASVILMDVEMPVMDGLQATRMIRETKKGKNVPIIALTGREGAQAEKECLESGYTAVLHKPVRKEHLLAMIDRYVRDEQFRR